MAGFGEGGGECGRAGRKTIIIAVAVSGNYTTNAQGHL